MVSVVLLGAGASYGSEEVNQCRPPLGDTLFDRLHEQGGIAASIPNKIKTLFRKDFESGMAEYYKYADGDIMRFQRELAHYLAMFQPSQKNVYLRLIQTLDTRRVIYCSLNYDLLFEQSAKNLGLNYLYGTERKEGYARLLKPHGSSNFWPDIPIGMFKDCTFSRNGQADIQAPIKDISREETLHRCRVEDSVAPAIAMYAVGKAIKISPDYVKEQQRMWARSVNAAQQVFVVGVRIHPVDEHIWGVLSKTKANVTYFGLSTSDFQSFTKWKEKSEKKNVYFVKSDFADCINIIQSRIM